MRSLSSHHEAEALAAGWVEWLRSLRWDYWATGTWERPVTASTALRTVETWLGKLGVPEAYATVGLQRGPAALTIHAHVLVGGVGRKRLMETQLRRTWVRRGHVFVEPYTPTKGAVEYLVRQAKEIELIGAPRLYESRQRGRRGG